MPPIRTRSFRLCEAKRLDTDAHHALAADDIDELMFPLPPAPPIGRERPLRIAYIGPAHGTSLHRARALERLGHAVTHIDPWAWLGRSRWTGRWLYHAGGVGAHLIIGKRLFQDVATSQPDLIWVNQGDFLGPPILRRLRTLGVPIVNLINDNPFSGRDGYRFRLFLQAIAHYDLVAVPRGDNIAAAYKAGARKVVRVWFSADEAMLPPSDADRESAAEYRAEVSFIGTWMPERGPFMVELIRRGVPLSIWGDGWQKAPEWFALAPFWRGPAMYETDAYCAATRSAKINLGLLSKGNRDLHTSRSVEIPAIGGLLCAERTAEHLALYDEGTEAVFWNDAAQCAEQCHRLLANDALRREIARRGHERALRNNLFNEPLMAGILKAAFDPSDPTQ